jgi:hypothetical protein
VQSVWRLFPRFQKVLSFSRALWDLSRDRLPVAGPDRHVVLDIAGFGGVQFETSAFGSRNSKKKKLAVKSFSFPAQERRAFIVRG